MRFQPIFFIIIKKKYVDERIFMVTITSWKIVIEKSGEPVIYLRNDTYWYNQKRCPMSEDIVVTEEGIEFSYTHKGRVTHYKCPYSSLSYKHAPSPLAFREKLEGVKVQRNMLSFLYEFFSGVLFSDDRYSFIKNREAFDVAALLAEYSGFSGQLGRVDWEKAAGCIKLQE